MELEKLVGIANEFGFVNADLNIFVKFMEKRFPNEMCEGYVRQWARRFVDGRVCSYMDTESLRCYKEAIDEVLP